MLEEIYGWYEKNLKASKTAPVQTANLNVVPPNLETDPQLTFEVYIELPGGTETTLICPRASFDPSWLDIKDNRAPPELFRCHCRLGAGSNNQRLRLEMQITRQIYNSPV